jgi:hypothetical protein
MYGNTGRRESLVDTIKFIDELSGEKPDAYLQYRRVDLLVLFSPRVAWYSPR